MLGVADRMRRPESVLPEPWAMSEPISTALTCGNVVSEGGLERTGRQRMHPRAPEHR